MMMSIDWFSLRISNSPTKPYTVDLYSRRDTKAAVESDIECSMVHVVSIEKMYSYAALHSFPTVLPLKIDHCSTKTAILL